MKAVSVIITVLAVFLLVGTASAYGPISFNQNGKLVVTLNSYETSNNIVFGVSSPFNHQMGILQKTQPPVRYTFDYTANSPVVLYITTGEEYTFYSDGSGSDANQGNLDHAKVTKNTDGTYTVGFEEGNSDALDWNYAVFTVSNSPTSTPVPVPEFPTFALPAGLIIGMFGAVFYIRESREN